MQVHQVVCGADSEAAERDFPFSSLGGGRGTDAGRACGGRGRQEVAAA